MTPPVLVPCLVALRNEFNELSPGRDKRSDGWIGDKAHSLSVSDHNGDESGRTPYEDADDVDEVHGLDVDETGPWPGGLDMGHLVHEVVKRHRLGLDDRLQNVIWAGQIASRSWGWTWRPYGGANQHYQHGHFSARYGSAQESSTRPFGLVARFAPKETDVALKDDLIKITEDTGEAINLPKGTEVSAASLIQHGVIRAGRAARDAKAALDLARKTDDKVAQILAILGEHPPAEPVKQPTPATAVPAKATPATGKK